MCFSGNGLIRGCFCWCRHMGGWFPDNRHVFLYWEFCVILVFLATPFWSLCVMTLLTEKDQKTYGGILVASWHFCELWTIGRGSWYLLDQSANVDLWMVFVSGSSYCWWVMWTKLLRSWLHVLDLPWRTSSYQVHIFHWPTNLSFSLSLVGGRLEGRPARYSVSRRDSDFCILVSSTSRCRRLRKGLLSWTEPELDAGSSVRGTASIGSPSRLK